MVCLENQPTSQHRRRQQQTVCKSRESRVHFPDKINARSLTCLRTAAAAAAPASRGLEFSEPCALTRTLINVARSLTVAVQLLVLLLLLLQIGVLFAVTRRLRHNHNYPNREFTQALH